MRITLRTLTNATATGSNVTVDEGGLYQYLVSGTFSGATIKLQVLGPDGSTFIDVPNSSMTAAGALNVELPAGSTVKSVITAGPPSGVNASLGYVR